MYKGTKILIASYRYISYSENIQSFLQCGTKVPLILSVQDAWRDFVRPIDTRMIERRRSRGHEVHAIRIPPRGLKLT